MAQWCQIKQPTCFSQGELGEMDADAGLIADTKKEFGDLLLEKYMDLLSDEDVFLEAAPCFACGTSKKPKADGWGSGRAMRFQFQSVFLVFLAGLPNTSCTWSSRSTPKRAHLRCCGYILHPLEPYRHLVCRQTCEYGPTCCTAAEALVQGCLGAPASRWQCGCRSGSTPPRTVQFTDV